MDNGCLTYHIGEHFGGALHGVVGSWRNQTLPRVSFLQLPGTRSR